MANNRELIAHTRNNRGCRHLLIDHLYSVAMKAADLACPFYDRRFMSLSWLIGIIHDLGKANHLFQVYLEQQEKGIKSNKVPHSPWSAAFVYFNKFAYKHDIALSVAGHHSGLDEIGNLTSKVKSIADENGILSEMLETYNQLVARAKRDPVFHSLLVRDGYSKTQNPKTQPLTALQRELLIRMLFSALIDADRLDTEFHFDPEIHAMRESKYTIPELVTKIKDNQNELIEKSDPTLVNQIRRDVYEACLNRACLRKGFFRLTVPTGGGKTRSALAFALEHALANDQKRVIFALPYTSIIDQTAGVYREILGEDPVLEHHSQIFYDDQEEAGERAVRLRLAEENWDIPVVVTTTVQLLESLFANKPSRCRKLHRVAGSVVVLDEAQSLPVELLRPTIQVLRDLVENYNTTVVLSTATQPALQGEYLKELSDVEIIELVPDYKDHFDKLKRVRYERIQKPLSIEELAREAIGHKQVLIILNTRKKAKELVKVIRDEGCLHLSTLLCGAHRKKVLEEVKRLLKDKKEIRLISTQVVEAGVDLDFPIVYRALGPLDRIVQAAGRCNREGKMPEPGRVVVFELQDERQPRGSYKAGSEVGKLVLAEHKSAEVLSNPEIYETYFARLYNNMDLDLKKIQESREKLSFPETAVNYRLIEENTLPVVVRYEGYDRVLGDWVNTPTKKNWRRLQPYIVNVFEWEANGYFKDGLITIITDGLYLWEGAYDHLMGLSGFEFDPADLII